MCGVCARYGIVTATGDARVDGLIAGTAWDGPITYAFPTRAGSYAYGGEIDTEFDRANRLQKDAATFALDREFGGSANDGFSVEGFTGASIAIGTAAHANIRAAQSALPPTSWAYLPGGDEQAGDVWLGVYGNVALPRAGNAAWQTVMHEMGHALGLKHGHESLGTFPALPSQSDSLEQSIMTYRSYEGGPTSGYTYARWAAPQTFMIADIAALQHLYGANFTTNAGSTIYSWKQGDGDTFVDGRTAIDAGGDVIFATIWDGGGTDTYDLRAFASPLDIDLEPGASSVFDPGRLAILGRGHRAEGNIYNALQYQGDTRSLIENAIGGSNRDRISGNDAGNRLSGRKGDDRLFGQDGDDTLVGGPGGDRLCGGSGNDRLSGGSGDDIFLLRSDGGADTIVDFRNGHDRIVLRSEDDAWSIDAIISSAVQIGDDVLLALGASATFMLRRFDRADLDSGDFIA